MTPAEGLSPASGEIGSYELIEEIGRGGMGVIYKARKRGSSELVAVKMLLTAHYDSAEAFARFKRETEAVAALEHPYVMPIRDICLEGEVPFFSMDLAVGGSLADLLPKYSGRWRQAAELMVQLAEGVQHAHEHGVLHRDLKPGNILFTGELNPLVSDFGLAKWLNNAGDASLTHSLMVFGTPHYVAPEQAIGKNKELTPATDVYSLGAIFFELLSGTPPFVGDNPLDILQQTLATRPPKLRTLLPSIPGELEEICMRCLEKEPSSRYPSAQAFSEDVTCWLLGKKLRITSRITSRSRNEWKKVTTLVACILVAAALVGASIYQRHPAKENASRESLGLIADAHYPLIFAWFLDEDSLLAPATQHFRTAVSKVFETTALQAIIPDPRSSYDATNNNLSLDPLATGSRANTGIVICESFRIVDSKLRVVSRLVQCSTGKTIFGRTDVLSRDCSVWEFEALLSELKSAFSGRSGSLLSQTTTTGPKIEARHLYRRAEEFYMRRTRVDTENAITLYQKALRIDPQFVDAWAGCAKAYSTKFRHWNGEEKWSEMSQEAAHRALQLDLYSAEAHGALGSCYYAEGRYSEACEQFLQSLEIDARSAGCNAHVGMCWREMGHPGRGLPWMLRAVQLDADHGVFSAIIGDTYMLLGADLLAEQAFRRYLDFNPDMVETRTSLVILRVWQKRYTEAKKLTAEISAQFPDDEFGKELAAEVAFFSRDYSAASARYNDLAQLGAYSKGWEFFGAVNPLSATAYILMSKGQFAQAQHMLNEAQHTDEQLLAAHPNNPRILHDLAALESIKGNHEGALHFLAMAISAGWVEHRSTMVDPRFEAVQKDAKFNELIAQTLPAHQMLH